MGIGITSAAINAAAANAQWKSTVERGAAVPRATARPVDVRGKCPGCGSWELSPTRNGQVCSYCRIPAEQQRERNV